MSYHSAARRLISVRRHGFPSRAVEAFGDTNFQILFLRVAVEASDCFGGWFILFKSHASREKESRDAAEADMGAFSNLN